LTALTAIRLETVGAFILSTDVARGTMHATLNGLTLTRSIHADRGCNARRGIVRLVEEIISDRER
jgi:hypothetical protein